MVAFSSTATDLVGGDANGQPDVFVRDRTAGTTSLVSVDLDGTSRAPVRAASHRSRRTGGIVAFASLSDDLVAQALGGVCSPWSSPTAPRSTPATSGPGRRSASPRRAPAAPAGRRTSPRWSAATAATWPGHRPPRIYRRPRQPRRRRVRSRPAAGRRAGPAGAGLRQASGVGRRRARHGDHERRRLVAPLAVTRVSITGPAAPDFATVADGGTATTLRRGQTCTPSPSSSPPPDPGTGSPAWRSPMVQAARRARSGCAAAARKHR